MKKQVDWKYVNHNEGSKNFKELINGSTFGIYNTFIIAGWLCINGLFVLFNNGFQF